MPRYSWLLLDADGTLFDFEKAETLAVESVLSGLVQCVSEDAIQRYKRINRDLWRSFELGHVSQNEIKIKRFELWLAELEIAANPRQIAADYARHLSEQAVLLLDAHDVVETLAGRYKLLIVTNGLKEVQRPRFERSSICPFIEDIIVSGELGVAKPDPGIFDAAFLRMGGPTKERVLMVGDSLNTDMQGALCYGIDACWCNFNNERTDLPITHTVNQLKQLLDFL
jgi:2-haloacid dehalogenase